MKNQNLVIYDSQALYDILNELNEFKGSTRIKLIEGERVFRLDK